jgi:hypothetical protein
MIALKKTEEVEIFQVELSLKVKTKQSPFIAILILALEEDEISAESLNEHLLTSLPIRACENLLMHLSNQGFLDYNSHRENYQLTEFGQQSAEDKSFWIGEKGIYNVYISKSNLFEQRIIKTVKVESKVENNKDNNFLRTPNEIKRYENQVLEINKTEILIEDVEDRCFHLKSENCYAEITSKENDTVLKISKENELLFQTTLEFSEDEIKESILLNHESLEYDSKRKLILVDFDKNNLSMLRKVKCSKPEFMRNVFNQIDIDNILHIPSNKKQALMWQLELLYKKTDKYFLSDKSFNEFAKEISEPFQKYYDLEIPERDELIVSFEKRNDAFYQVAKLTTINYLTY